jgi:hypothetical protein
LKVVKKDQRRGKTWFGKNGKTEGYERVEKGVKGLENGKRRAGLGSEFRKALKKGSVQSQEARRLIVEYVGSLPFCELKYSRPQARHKQKEVSDFLACGPFAALMGAPLILWTPKSIQYYKITNEKNFL